MYKYDASLQLTWKGLLKELSARERNIPIQLTDKIILKELQGKKKKKRKEQTNTIYREESIKGAIGQIKGTY